MVEKNPERTRKVVVSVELKGVGGHSSKPHVSKNPVVAGFEFLHLVQNRLWWGFSQFENVAIVPVEFDFGTKQNIIPESGSLKLAAEFSTDGQFAAIQQIVKNALEAVKVNYAVDSTHKIEVQE